MSAGRHTLEVCVTHTVAATRRCGYFLLALIAPVIAAACMNASADVAATGPATRPATSARGDTARGAKPFRPGVGIDWSAPAVLVDGEVALDRGPLEFFACFGGKEHESVIRLKASGNDIYLALGLIGLTPGRPPRWNADCEAFEPAQGDLVSVEIEFEDGGVRRRIAATSMLRGIEYGEAQWTRPWVFAGSIRRPDGSLSCDRSGVGIALVDFEDSLLSPPRAYVSRNQDLWAEVNTDAVPPRRTPVVVLLSPARPWSPTIALDHRGDVTIDGRMATPADVAEQVLLIRRLDVRFVLSLRVEGAYAHDQRRLEAMLAQRGVEPGAIQWVRSPKEPQPGSVSAVDR